MKFVFVLLTVAVVLCAAHGIPDSERPPHWHDLGFHGKVYRYAMRTIQAEAQKMRKLHTPDKLKCAECRVAATIVNDLLKNATTAKEVEETLEGVCHKITNSSLEADVCVEVVKVTLKIAELVVIKGWHYIIPNAICADILNLCNDPCCSSDAPEQLRLSFASQQAIGQSTSMRVNWVNLNKPTNPWVQYHAEGSEQAERASGSAATYHHGGWQGWVSTAVMTGLRSNTTYYYRVSSGGIVSDWNVFTTLPLDAGTSTRPLRFIFVADMGYDAVSNNTVAMMQKLTVDKDIDFVVHSGDIGYADSDEPAWDVFGRKIGGITSRVPYMTAPGNHEFLWNFTAYRVRYPGPHSPGTVDDAMYYRFDVGSLTFMMLDSETFVNTPDIDELQRTWAEEEMNNANGANQFMFTTHHRPLYATEGKNGEHWDNILRKQVEALYVKERVPIVTYGHVHNYERTFPVRDGIVTSKSLINTSAPMYLLNGAAGNNEGQDTPRGNWSWSATTSAAVGLSVFEFASSPTTHTLSSKFYRANDGTVIDSFTMQRPRA